MLKASTTGFVFHFLRRYPRRTVLLVGLLVLSSLAEGIGVLALLPLLELAMTPGDGPRSGITRTLNGVLEGVGLEPRLDVLLLIIVLAMGAKGGFRLLAMRQVGVTVSRVATDLRLALIRALLHTRWSHFTSTPAGRYANAIAAEATRAANGYRSALTMLAAVIHVLLYAAVAFWISPLVAVVAILAGSVTVLGLGRLVQMSRAANQAQMRLTRSLVGRLTDALQGIKPIKAMGREAHIQPLLEHETREINAAQERQVVASEAVTAAQEPLLVLTMSLFLYFAVNYGNQSFASVLVFAFLFYRLAGRIGVVQVNYQAITTGESFFWSIQGSIDTAVKEREPKAGSLPATLEDRVAFEDIEFAYGDQPVLSGASLEIPAGRFVALVGPSGAGKTTVADLLVRLQVPQAGRILVDGVPLADIELAAWRRSIGYVPQEMFLFHDTVLNNVTLGDPAITEERARAALMAAGAWEFIAQLPEGMATVLGERGSRVSGGQRQRIAIARALAPQPRLLVLDEVTTALDPRTEEAICRTLTALLPDVTILSISHQPAMVEAADMVYRIEAGKIRRVEMAAQSA